MDSSLEKKLEAGLKLGGGDGSLGKKLEAGLEVGGEVNPVAAADSLLLQT